MTNCVVKIWKLGVLISGNNHIYCDTDCKLQNARRYYSMRSYELNTQQNFMCIEQVLLCIILYAVDIFS